MRGCCLKECPPKDTRALNLSPPAAKIVEREVRPALYGRTELQLEVAVAAQLGRVAVLRSNMLSFLLKVFLAICSCVVDFSIIAALDSELI